MNAFARRGACPALARPMQTGDGLLARLNPVAAGLPPKTLIALCESAGRHGNGIMEVTARGSIQIRGLTPQSALLLAAEVDALGIAVRTGVPVETGPLAGLDPDEVADPRPLAKAIRRAADAAGLAGRLGPKVSVVVDGGGRFAMGDILADVRLTATRGVPPRWRLAIGGTAATARPLGLLDEADACEVAIKILEQVAGLGSQARARDLTEEDLGGLRSAAPPSGLPAISPTRGEISCRDDFRQSPASLKKAVQPKRLISPLVGEMAGRPEGGAKGLSHADPVESPSERPAATDSFPAGILPLADSTHALAVALPFGSMPAAAITRLAAEAAAEGAREIRPAPGRALLVVGLAQEACAGLREVAAGLGFVTLPGDPRLYIAACPGAPACASGRIATREIAETVANAHAGLLDGSFTLHISGCAKGCAHPNAAVLTLVGGENGAGLVVNGTAKTLPGAISPRYEAARGLGRVAALAAGARCGDETMAACLARLGEAAIRKAFERE